MAAARKKPAAPRKLDARPDTIDFRDLMFVPTLVEVPVEQPLAAFLRLTGGKPFILNQGQQGACTGFGLAAVCNHLLRARQVRPDKTPVSAAMLYAMARRYDEWPGTDYDGSSPRGAMKGWHKHGVCSEALWRPQAGRAGAAESELTPQRIGDAVRRPLGAYFRVNHRDVVAMHAAIAEVGILYAAADVHTGWDKVGRNGRIPFGEKILGGHAFAIVGYDAEGFWIQNSWGPQWGLKGFGHLAYGDWLDHGYDVWVARLGAPVKIDDARVSGAKLGGLATSRLSFPDIRPHVVSIGNDGALRAAGTYANDADDIKRIFAQDFPRITARWKKKRILLYAHGGLVPEANALQRIENYLEVLREADVYPLAFIWRTDFWTTVKDILQDALRGRRTEGVLDATKDFMLDRIDDTLERLARAIGGDCIWDEMRENALLSTLRADGGARFVASQLAQLLVREPGIEVHIAAHSAGSIFLAPLVQLLTSKGRIDVNSLQEDTGYCWHPDAAAGADVAGTDAPGPRGFGAQIKTCTLWAPACTVGLFKAAYLPALTAGSVQRMTLFGLKDTAEQDDHCAHMYNKSLLYLVSNAFEKKPRPASSRDGWPILGMEKFIRQDRALMRLIDKGAIDYVTAPNDCKPGTLQACGSSAHGDFDDDKATVQATLARILGRKSTAADFRFSRSAASTRDRRKMLI